MHPATKNWLELIACGAFALLSAYTFLANIPEQEWLWVLLGLISTPYWSMEFGKRWKKV